MTTEKDKVIKESEIMSFIEYALKRERDAGKSEAISNFAEKIYEFIGLERYYDAQAHQKVIESEKLIEFMKNLYNKLVEEQTSSGETK